LASGLTWKVAGPALLPPKKADGLLEMRIFVA
jgi:hypothetical protein